MTKPDSNGWFRVKGNDTGHEYSVRHISDSVTVVDKPASDFYGNPYPAKHNQRVETRKTHDPAPVTRAATTEAKEAKQ